MLLRSSAFSEVQQGMNKGETHRLEALAMSSRIDTNVGPLVLLLTVLQQQLFVARCAVQFSLISVKVDL